MGKRGKLTKHQPFVARNLYSQGYSHSEIGDALEISRATLFRYYKKAGGLTVDVKIKHLQHRKDRENERAN